jgi:hypothetical protein
VGTEILSYEEQVKRKSQVFALREKKIQGIHNSCLPGRKGATGWGRMGMERLTFTKHI